jgi:hypothetical protein
VSSWQSIDSKVPPWNALTSVPTSSPNMSDVCQLIAGEKTEIGICETIGNRARRFLRLRSQARSTGAIRAVQIDGHADVAVRTRSRSVTKMAAAR